MSAIKLRLAKMTTLSFLCALVFVIPVAAQSGSGGAVDLKGTDSAGSFSYGGDHVRKGSSTGHGFKYRKSEGSKSKSYQHHISGKKSGKGYSHHGKLGHGYSKKSEGSKSKSYSHGKGHHKSEGSHGKGYSHKKSARHGGHGKNPFQHVLCVREKLGLTEAQIGKIKDLEFEYKKVRIQAKADHQIAHMELEREVHSGRVDEAKIRAAGAKIVAAKAKKIMAMVEAKVQLLNVLTAEQREKMTKKHSKH
ncbi:MAG TPA: hypothetical protein DCM60_08845 [Nitrospina sp.]|jgi:Spy/CpxP family protein refolding chaperone|nr:hypothetical protein [Nitrospina sp.]